jgi:hypothetical protein
LRSQAPSTPCSCPTTPAAGPAGAATVYYGVTDVTLLGINSWNDDDLARKAGSYLERSVFVDGFFLGSRTNPLVEPFGIQFTDTFHQQPAFWRPSV